MNAMEQVVSRTQNTINQMENKMNKMKKIGVTLLMLASATVGHGASYFVDFEDGLTQGIEVSSGAWRYGTVTNFVGVGGSRAELRARTDLPSPLTWLVGWDGSGGPIQFRGNWNTKYNQVLKISWEMKDGDYATTRLVQIGLFSTSAAGKQWQKTFAAPLDLSSFTLYDTGNMDAGWDDATAIAAGWTKPGTASWATTLSTIDYFALATDGGGATFSGVGTVVFNTGGGDPADGAILDNILIATVPEPSTLVLLSLAGLLIRRRV